MPHAAPCHIPKIHQYTMKTAILATLCASAAAFAPASKQSASVTQLSESKADLQDMAKKLNPIVGFYDPLNLAEANFWGAGNEATIGFLRHSEIKYVADSSFTLCRSILLA